MYKNGKFCTLFLQNHHRIKDIEQVMSFSVTVAPSLDVRGLGGEPDDVGADEDHAGAHDGEERPEGHVRLQRLQSRALQEC